MSDYILWTDKSEQFECEIDIEGASLTNSIARLVLESKDLNLMFTGNIQNGKCIIPIRKMKGLLEENCSGNIKLEVIVEDTYFSPWSTNFCVKPSKKLSVIVKEQTEIKKPKVTVTKVQENIASDIQPVSIVKNNKEIAPIIKSNANSSKIATKSAPKKIENKIIKETSKNVVAKKDSVIELSDSKVIVAITELISEFDKKGITDKDLNTKMPLAEKIITEYFRKNSQYNYKKSEIINKTMKVLLNK